MQCSTNERNFVGFILYTHIHTLKMYDSKSSSVYKNFLVAYTVKNAVLFCIKAHCFVSFRWNLPIWFSKIQHQLLHSHSWL